MRGESARCAGTNTCDTSMCRRRNGNYNLGKAARRLDVMTALYSGRNSMWSPVERTNGCGNGGATDRPRALSYLILLLYVYVIRAWPLSRVAATPAVTHSVFRRVARAKLGKLDHIRFDRSTSPTALRSTFRRIMRFLL